MASTPERQKRQYALSLTEYTRSQLEQTIGDIRLAGGAALKHADIKAYIDNILASSSSSSSGDEHQYLGEQMND